MQAGHYTGSTADGEPVSFDVTDDGEVTNIIASLGGTSLTISRPYPVRAGGWWGGDASGDAIEACIHGRLTRVGARGTLRTRLGRIEPFRTTGPVRWSARRVTSLR